jgi:hypothetical protein
MSTPGPCQIVVVPVPVAGSPAWARPVRPPWTKPEADRRQHWAKQAIPRPGPIDRETLERLRDLANRAVAERKPLIEALLRG